ncbi:hypothetical protein [Candidatus Binatus sp.]|uniref:hypothetical protein n=1 Tax=Candidatus Binatus sp. TaxID=2811406 RepID=UPI002B492A25|nr:hypothetical protein [Candidatus Binatus sp.]
MRRSCARFSRSRISGANGRTSDFEGETKMERLNDFKRHLNARESDPRRRVIADVEAIVEQLKADMPDDIFERIIGNRLVELESRLGEKIESGRFGDCDPLVTAFRFDLLRTIQYERSEGLLKPITGASEVKRCGWLFERFRWNGFETGALAHLLRPGEIIREVNYRQIVTDQRTIGRYSDFFDELRPSGYSKEHWMSQCTSERVIAEAENAERREAEQAARPFSDFSGPNVRPQ